MNFSSILFCKVERCPKQQFWSTRGVYPQAKFCHHWAPLLFEVFLPCMCTPPSPSPALRPPLPFPLSSLSPFHQWDHYFTEYWLGEEHTSNLPSLKRSPMEGQPQSSNMVNGQPSEQVFSSSVATSPDVPNETGHCSAVEEMDMPQVVHTRACWPTSPVSEESVLDWNISVSSGRHNKQPREGSPPLLALAAGTQLTENSAAYFLWPPVCRPHGTAEERAAHFKGLQKDANFKLIETTPTGQQATTLLDLMIIRAYNSRLLRRVSLGTAVGFRTKKGVLTDIPAIIVFVARKVQKAWLNANQRLPVHLEGPGGIWCDVDVVEFCYYGAPDFSSREHVYTELAEDLQGNHPCIGPGSQVASQETIGTLGAIVQSRTGARQVGFLMNRHVAVDLNYPSQKMFHPLPPNVGPGVYLGAVERATSFITDEGWYNIFASTNPETFVRADGAFIPFSDSLNLSRVTTAVKGVGEMGDVIAIDLQAPIRSIVGKEVMKVGRSSGLTKGNIMAYALEYNDEKGICFFTDFLIVGENKQAFDLEGDSGSLILMTDDWRKKPRPVGIIWGSTANRGRLKLGNGCGPENWTSGVDLEHLLEWLQLDLITSDTALEDAIEEQRRLRMGVSIMGDSSPARPASGNARTAEENHQWEVNGAEQAVLDFEELHTTQEGVSVDSIREIDFGIQHVDRSVEHAPWSHDLSDLKKLSDEDLSFSLHLNEREAKRRRQ